MNKNQDLEELRLLTPKDTAALLGVRVEQLNLARNDATQKSQPRIPYVKLGNRQVRYKLSEIKAYIERCVIPV